MAIDTSNFKNGLKIVMDGDPYTMTYFQHVKPGKGGAFVRTKLKNLRNGRVQEKTFRAGEKVTEADIEDRKMQYLYQDGDAFVFMDNESYDQITIPKEQVGDQQKYLKENEEVAVVLYNDAPLTIELPQFLIAAIAQTDPGIKGDTASGATKPATLETGAVVQVPLFLKEGDNVRVDTRTGEYIERVNS